MNKKLNSLAIFILTISFINVFLFSSNILAATILPMKKPGSTVAPVIKNSIKVDKTRLNVLLPQSKPNVKRPKVVPQTTKNYILPQTKPADKIKNDIAVVKPEFKKNIDNRKTIIPEQPVVKQEEKKPEAVAQLTIPEVKTEIVKKEIPVKTNLSNFLLPEKKPPSFHLAANKALPSSSVLSDKDYKIAAEVMNLIKDYKWETAIKLKDKIKDREFKNLITWMYLKEPRNQASFSDYINFIKTNDDYPRISRLQYLAEHKINFNRDSTRQIMKWFEDNPPLSGFGKLKLAEAHVYAKNIPAAEPLIREGWIDARLSTQDIKFFRAKFKGILKTSDYLNRAEYMAWERKYWDLKRLLRYLPKEERALYNARQILMSNSYGVDNAIKKVPAQFANDEGLKYDRLQWRLRRGRLESSLEIINEIKDNSIQLKHPNIWWSQKERLARDIMYRKKNYALAYEIVSKHQMQEGPEYAEAEWYSGWLALSFLKNSSLAIKHFENFYANVGYPISLARGAYWLGLAHKKSGNSIESNQYFAEAAKFLTTFYGQLAFKEINPEKDFVLKDDTKIDKKFEKEFSENKLIKHVIVLKELNYSKYSKDILKHLAALDIEKGSEVLAANLSVDVGRYDFAIQIAKQASYEKRFYLNINYPIITVPREVNGVNMPPPELIHAIIRQESEFDTDANSHAGAKGMMQLMTYTAKLVAKQANLPYSRARLNEDPEYNVQLGSFYFNSLLNEYTGVFPFAIAGYNAGPNRVKTWKRVNGDPSDGKISYVDWIEMIRFEETRNYVQRVLENYNVYKFMFSSGEPVRLVRFFQ